jgi:large subunit ribosomal protein L25
MKTIHIEGEIRDRLGKGGARTSRRDGRIPAVLYGRGKTIHLTVDRKEFVRAMQEAQGENIIFDVKLPGESKPLKSIAREIQHHPVSRSAVHVDFQHIDMLKKIHVSVVVNLVGEPEGVRNFGGILEQPARELEILCLPSEIPASIDIDATELMVGDTIHVSDVTPDKFEFLQEGSKVIAHVAAPTVEKEPVAEEEEAAVAEGEPAEGEMAEKGEEAAPAEEKKGEGEG